MLYVSDLLTGRADVWYRANQHKRLPNEQTKWLEWDSYGRFKNEFMEAHRNHYEQREAKQSMLKDYQRKGERMVNYISRNRAPSQLYLTQGQNPNDPNKYWQGHIR